MLECTDLQECCLGVGCFVSVVQLWVTKADIYVTYVQENDD